jgi:hypothetical protein
MVFVCEARGMIRTHTKIITKNNFFYNFLPCHSTDCAGDFDRPGRGEDDRRASRDQVANDDWRDEVRVLDRRRDDVGARVPKGRDPGAVVNQLQDHPAKDRLAQRHRPVRLEAVCASSESLEFAEGGTERTSSSSSTSKNPTCCKKKYTVLLIASVLNRHAPVLGEAHVRERGDPHARCLAGPHAELRRERGLEHADAAARRLGRRRGIRRARGLGREVLPPPTEPRAPRLAVKLPLGLGRGAIHAGGPG